MMRYILLIIILCISQICLGQSKGGHWEFENNGDDSAIWDTADNNGTLMNNAVYGDSLPLQQGMYYLLLDNSQAGDYFRIDDSNDLDFNNENVGLSAWIYPFVLANDVYFLINKGQQDANPKTTNYALRISNTQHLEFLIRDAANQAQLAASSFTLPANQWTFVAAYYNYSAGKVYLWNVPAGNAVDSVTFNQNLITNSHPLAIGGWYSANTTLSKPFKGCIDDVRISGNLQDIIPGQTAVRNDENTDAQLFPAGQFSCAPNPVCLSQGNNLLKVTLDFPESQPFTVSIFNVLGQKIYESQIRPSGGRKEFFLNLPEILGDQRSTGFYFIQVRGKDIRQIKKLLIIK